MLPTLITVLAALALSQSTPTTPIRVSTTAQLQLALNDAKPGMRILLAPGEYQSMHASNVRGAEGKPITLVAEVAASPPVFKGGLQFSDASHLEIENVVVTGAPANGINIDDGGTFDSPSHHVVLRGVTVRDCGGRGNEDGIKLSGVDDFRVERCTIERWGRGGSAIDMVGCRRGVIEACTIRDLETDMASTGIQTKGGSRDVVVRTCRFEHAGQRAVNIGGSTGLAYFRPKPEGFEAKDITVEGCTFVGSPAPIAFVGVDGAIVRSNTFYCPTKWVMRILQETRESGFVACRNGTFTNNLIAYKSTEVSVAVNVGSHTAADTFTFARNFWFCMDRPERSIPKLPQPERDAAGGADPRFRDAAKGDLRLQEGSPAAKYGASAFGS